MEKALELIKSLEKIPEAVSFLKPVDYKVLGLVDYPFIIKNPMDLSTVRKKIKSDKYSSIEEVLEDLMLIWENCRTYNQAGSVK
jgi:bromodomain-containing factor 1